MLVPTTAVKCSSVDRLTRAWANLYAPDFQSLPLHSQPTLYAEVLSANRPEGRVATTQKLNEHLLKLQSEVASVQTSALYAYMQQVLHLRELRRLAEASFQVYKLLTVLYQQDAMGTASMIQQLQANPSLEDLTISEWGYRQMEWFAATLEPVLLEFQQEHRQTQDWRTLGFLTTQFNFCNQWLLRKLTPGEQVLFQPYLRFVEEQVAQPWQRVCAAAVTHEADSPIVAIVEQLMLQVDKIAQATHQRLIQICPNHRSRRGQLDHPDIVHSCTRDLKMFQSYLLLALLQGNLAVIETELLGLCIRVLPSVGTKWDLISIWVPTLADEMLHRLEPVQQDIVRPYTVKMQQLFLNAKDQLDTPLARGI
jgi:hypothetical protein